ncbi:DUF1553 domain-containing protein [Gimesia sp.]|uniref:DUF1553 domain-containing protein n=1 Tax=Gimesia sp. TaxID=2024833 RepID=UPI003A90EA20
MKPLASFRERRTLFIQRTILIAILFCAAIPSLSAAAENPAAQTPVVYESRIQKVFEQKCLSCHNAKTRKAGLDLSSPESILKGSESGRIIQAGDADASLLFQMIDAGEMPPDEKNHLSTEELQSLRDWLNAGAHFRTAVKTVPAVTQHDIIPLLHLRCVVCHGGRRKEAGLDLRTKASILKGGKSGPAVIPGNASDSLLLKRIHAGEMPPPRRLVSASVKPMQDNERELLSQWIALKLPEVELSQNENEELVTEADRGFWSFQPPQQPTVPVVKGQDRVRNPIDAFVLQRLEQKGLSLSPAASKRTLIRRLYFDLTGLPPQPEEIEQFLNDTDPRAYDKLVDQLLASRRYGERWARHWLDAAGYADSEGAQNEDKLRPHMYRYRDYVIRSLNEDKPYSRFLTEQIAGDELVDYQSGKITPEVYDCLVATGFLRTAPDRTFADITNFVPDRLEVIADEMDILGSAVLGLTIKCARCHSHKFDPIPQRDYYRLTAIFKEAYDEHDWLKSQGPRTLSSIPKEERDKYQQREQELSAKVQDLKQEIAALTAQTQQLQMEKQAKSLEAADPQYKQKCDQLQQKIKALEARRQPQPRIRALWSRGTPSPSYILMRGNYLTPGRPVEPGVPAVLSGKENPLEVISRPVQQENKGGRRLAFARWLTQPDHPLTARVMVNRIWMHHFGRGIVKTPENFGRAGERPSHPELLDWLATEFVLQNWSLKALHRLMVTSETYRQTSAVSDEALRKDPDGSLLSRMPLKRMEGEVLRDTLLYLSGQLDETPFGPADPVDVRRDGLVTSKASDQGWRRSIYVLQRRTQIPTLLENFDYPQMGPNCVRRGESLVAPQALHLLNDQMIHRLATEFAVNLRNQAGNSPSDQVKLIYRLAFGREASEEEITIGIETMNALNQEWLKANPKTTAEEAAQKSLTNFCHAIFNLAEFQYID